MKAMEGEMKTGTGQTCKVATCYFRSSNLLLLAGQADFRSSSSRSLGRHAWGNTGTSSWHLGMEHPGAVGSGEVEAEVEVIQNNLARIGLLIYSMELEEWQSSSFLAPWASESRAHGRAEELAGTHKGAVTYSVIAGRMKKSHLVYKVNGHVEFVWWQRLQIGNAKKTDEKGPVGGAEAARSASPSAKRRRARCCVILFRVLIEWQGTLDMLAPLVRCAECCQCYS